MWCLHSSPIFNTYRPNQVGLHCLTETPGTTTVKSKTKYNYFKSDSGHG